MFGCDLFETKQGAHMQEQIDSKVKSTLSPPELQNQRQTTRYKAMGTCEVPWGMRGCWEQGMRAVLGWPQSSQGLLPQACGYVLSTDLRLPMNLSNNA